MKQLFTEHPRSVGESYFGHMGSALYFAGQLFVAALACAAHAFLPFLFKTEGSRRISHLHDRMVAHRPRAGISVFRGTSPTTEA